MALIVISIDPYKCNNVSNFKHGFLTSSYYPRGDLEKSVTDRAF